MSDGYEIAEGCDRVDLDRVHGWLAAMYWSPGVPHEVVERAMRNSSLVLSVHRDGEQVAYCRVVSDRATFAYLADVYVDEAHRGRGIASAMVRHALAHPEHQGLRRWMLATRDAHHIYAACGFETLADPDRWMYLRPGQQAAPSTPGSVR